MGGESQKRLYNGAGDRNIPELSMIHPGEHIALAFAHHADEFHLLLAQVVQKTLETGIDDDRIEYIHHFLHEFSHSFAAHRFGKLRIHTRFHEADIAPAFRIPGEHNAPLQEPLDLMIRVRFIGKGKKQMEKVVFHRFLMKRKKEDLWYVPRRHVRFISQLNELEFGSIDGQPQIYRPMINDRFTGSFWFINPRGNDFILSALGLEKNSGDIIRMSELQGPFRFRCEVGIVRQLMGRLGDECVEGSELARFSVALRRFLKNPGSPEFDGYRSPRSGSGFFSLDLDLTYDE